MNTHDLIKVGRFGYNFCNDDCFELRIYKNFRKEFLSFHEFFVILEDKSGGLPSRSYQGELKEQKVRFVIIEDLELKGSRLFGRFKDPEIITELKQAPKAWLAIDKKTYNSLALTDEELIGFDLFYQDQKIGKVTDVFDNKAQEVLVVTLDNDEKSFMIPDVEEYIVEKDHENYRVIARNIRELIDL